jgi:hypothetical protein
MEQKSDWVRPGARAAPLTPSPQRASAIPIAEDLDRSELAELARQIEERTRSAG